MKRIAAVLLIGILLLFVGCTGQLGTQSVAQIPTQLILPSATPTDTLTPSPTFTPSITPTPSVTSTPDVMATAVANGNATNAALQQTLDAVWTAMAPTLTASQTYTPTLTFTPSKTITATIAPTLTSTATEAVQEMRTTLMYVRSRVNLRTCAASTCDRVDQLGIGEAVMVTGRITGEEFNPNNTRWYRVDNRGRAAYIYSDFLISSPPTQPPPPTSPPLTYITFTPAPTVYVPPSSGGGGSSSGVRTGAVCVDGWISSSTGRGTCSHHGGVAYWLYR